jgi:hypothetical protein
MPVDASLRVPLRTNGYGRTTGKLRLLSRDNLDKRIKGVKLFDRITADIYADLGGEAELSRVEKELIAGFAGAALIVNDLNCKLMLGRDVDPLHHAQACSTLVRVASRVGIHRRARDVTPRLSEYLSELPEDVDVEVVDAEEVLPQRVRLERHPHNGSNGGDR